MTPVVLLFTLFALFAEPRVTRLKLRGWKKIRGAVGTADIVILSFRGWPNGHSCTADDGHGHNA